MLEIVYVSLVTILVRLRRLAVLCCYNMKQHHGCLPHVSLSKRMRPNPIKSQSNRIKLRRLAIVALLDFAVDGCLCHSMCVFRVNWNVRTSLTRNSLKKALGALISPGMMPNLGGYELVAEEARDQVP